MVHSQYSISPASALQTRIFHQFKRLDVIRASCPTHRHVQLPRQGRFFAASSSTSSRAHIQNTRRSFPDTSQISELSPGQAQLVHLCYWQTKHTLTRIQRRHRLSMQRLL